MHWTCQVSGSQQILTTPSSFLLSISILSYLNKTEAPTYPRALWLPGGPTSEPQNTREGKEVEKNKLHFAQESREVKRRKKENRTALEIVINAWNRTKNIIFPSENVITQPYYCLASRRVFLIGNVSLITNKKKNYIISNFDQNLKILYAAPLSI